MLKPALFSLYVFFHTFFCGCPKDKRRSDFGLAAKHYILTQIGKIDREGMDESSGFAWADDGNLWTQGDSGCPNKIFKVDLKGSVLESREIPNTMNTDWEELAKDKSGNLYIGDFGNNHNKRHNLRIFKVHENEFSKVDTIQVRYADQHDFPPKKKVRNFDCEAFFWHNHSLYLFSKDRGRDNLVKIYKVPDVRGSYSLKPIDSLQIGTMITAADISPDGKHFALLGYGKLYVFETGAGDKLFSGGKYCIPVGKTGQAEALVFENDTDLIFSNESGRIFRLKQKL